MTRPRPKQTPFPARRAWSAVAADPAATRRQAWSLSAWSTVVPALFAVMACATAGQIAPQSRDSDGRIAGLPSAAGIYLTNNVNGCNGTENLGDAAARLLSGMRETRYQHRTHVDKSEGAYDMDCSGFVDYLLKQIAPAQFATLKIEPGHTRPRAAMYFELFNRLNKSPLPGWEAIPKLGEARRGDILAWQLAASTDEPGDTGHVVIVAAAPVEQANHLYRVQVYDSSVIHHDDDSRPEGTNGVGAGVITFRVDTGGKPVGFQFNSHAHYHGEPVAIGRLVAGPGAVSVSVSVSVRGGQPLLGAVEGDAFFQRDPNGRGRSFLRVSKEDQAQGTMGGIEAKPSGKFRRARDRRSGPEGTEPTLMGGKEEILHRTGGGAELVESGNLAAVFRMGGNGDNGLSLQAVFTKLSTLFRAQFVHAGGLVIQGLKCAG
jgi:hypothetical protein